MAQSNYNSNEHADKFYTYKLGLATITMLNNVYTLNTVVAPDRGAEVRIAVNGVGIGDLVTIEADINGVGSITSVLLPAGSNTAITKRTVTVNGITKVRTTFAVTKLGDIQLAIGSGWNLDFAGTISNIGITVKSASGVYAPDVTLPKMQRFTIQTTATGTFSLREDWSLNAGTLSNLDANTLQLTLAAKPTRRYQGFPNLMTQVGSVQYVPRIDVDANNLVTLKFYTVAGVAVPLANVAASTYVGILLF